MGELSNTLQDDLSDTAARATINQRCALAFLHDVRGSMQALFSAMELLGRAARSGGTDMAKTEKAWELARRAVGHHERLTMDTLELLTLQPAQATEIDAGTLVNDVVHFLRNEAALKDVRLTVPHMAQPHIPQPHMTQLHIIAERPKIHSLLVGLIMAAIDGTPRGEPLPIWVEHGACEAVIGIGCNAEYGAPAAVPPLHELTLGFARRYLAANGARLEIAAEEGTRGVMRLHYPCVVGAGGPATPAVA